MKFGSWTFNGDQVGGRDGDDGDGDDDDGGGGADDDGVDECNDFCDDDLRLHSGCYHLHVDGFENDNNDVCDGTEFQISQGRARLVRRSGEGRPE